MELFFGYLAGLLTLINPCVLPVLPIVLASAMQAGRYGPLAIAGGMCLSFVTLGMLIATFGYSIGLTDTRMSEIGAVMMMVFGLFLLVPRLNSAFVTATATISDSADTRFSSMPVTSLKSHFIGGLLLGAIWSPCIGPTLGGAISMASQGKNLGWAFLIMLSFGLYLIIKKPMLDYSERKHDYKSYVGFWLKGFLINTINPFTFFFWMGVISSYVLGRHIQHYEAMVLLSTILAVIIVSDAGKVVLAHFLKKWLTPSHINKVSNFSGVILVLFGLVMGYRVI